MVDLPELQKIKDKGTHRYWLWRENPNVESGRIMAWVMCNPSWSRRLETDLTICYKQKDGNSFCTRKYDDCTVKFVRNLTFQQSFCDNVYKGLFVVNLYPYRDSDSDGLGGMDEGELGYNDSEQIKALELVFKYSNDLFFAWGNYAAGKAGAHFGHAKDKVKKLAKHKHEKYFYFPKGGIFNGQPTHPRYFFKNKLPFPEPQEHLIS